MKKEARGLESKMHEIGFDTGGHIAHSSPYNNVLSKRLRKVLFIIQ